MRRPGAAHSVAWKHHKREIQLGSRSGYQNTGLCLTSYRSGVWELSSDPDLTTTKTYLLEVKQKNYLTEETNPVTTLLEPNSLHPDCTKFAKHTHLRTSLFLKGESSDFQQNLSLTVFNRDLLESAYESEMVSKSNAKQVICSQCFVCDLITICRLHITFTEAP
ncbi:hypothetical protein CSKR_105998 [Clonorchis sinensis]|uniref:Uncharacterized protein n=1 Tax=Clonorchis sinensis TaxID=79923 RepID=A0A3R7ESC7_CLOSI|nr:hypothetical protein CSKR_105998 [Clonorchis sinensis]